MEKEIWKDVVGYEGLYQVSNLGYVKRKNRILKHTYREHYKAVILCKNGKTKTFQVHRLVALAFIPNTNNLPQINHIDGNKLNNKVSNLEWVTPSENRKHGIRLGLIRFDGVSIPVNLVENGVVVKKYASCRQAASELKLDEKLVSKVAHGLLSNVKGYVFELAK